MQFVPYLSFDGQCREAFEFYAGVLGGEIVAMIPHRGSPAEAHVPPEHLDRIMNAHLVAEGAELMGGDSPFGYAKPVGFSISIQIEDEERARAIFSAFSEGGTVIMDLAPTFWAKQFGMVHDRFGTPWMINCGISR